MILFLAGVFFSFSLQALELETTSFFLCRQKTASGVFARSLRIHRFPEENKCGLIYSVQGRDKMISYGRWDSFCRKSAEKVVSKLEKSLWECESGGKASVFYSFKEPLKKTD